MKKILLTVLTFFLFASIAFATVTNTIQPPKQYTGNGVTTNFPITFDFVNNSDITVSFVNDSDGSIDTWVLDAIGDEGYTIVSGEVVANTAPDDGTLVIDGVTELTQELDLKNNRATPAELYEAALDKATLQSRDNKAIIDRAMVAPATADPDIDYTAPDYEASSYWQWHPTEKKLRNAAVFSGGGTIGTDVGDLVKLVDDGSGNGIIPEAQRYLIDEDDMVSDVDDQAPTQQSVKAYVDSRFPTGAYLEFPTGVPPPGFLECDGSAISRTTYSNLFAIISDDYGVGDGSTTFNLPDLRGYFPRGWDHGVGIDLGTASVVGDTHSNTTIDSIPDTSILEVGMVITGSGIPASTTIDSIDSSVAITISQAATATAADITFICTNRTDRGDGTIGDEVGTEQPGGFEAHSHGIADGVLCEVGSGAGRYRATTGTTQSSTETGGNETRPININVMWCMKY